MPLQYQDRFDALLGRFEEQTGEMLRHRREEEAAAAAFIERFQRVRQTVLRPCFEELAEALCAHGVAAQLSYGYSYAAEAILKRESLTLKLGTRTLGPESAKEPQAGVCVVADAASRQLCLGVRSLAHPEQQQVIELPVMEQLTSELIEEELITALEHALLA